MVIVANLAAEPQTSSYVMYNNSIFNYCYYRATETERLFWSMALIMREPRILAPRDRPIALALPAGLACAWDFGILISNDKTKTIY